MTKQQGKSGSGRADLESNVASSASSGVDLSESSIYGKGQDGEDGATEGAIERLEAITGGAEQPLIVKGRLARQFDALDASTDEELDALKVDLRQDGDDSVARDGSGRVADDVAEEQIAAFTEVGPKSENRGGVSVASGREDTSDALRRHRPHSEIGDDMDEVEGGNIDPPLDEDLEIDDPEDEGETKA